MNWFTRLFVEGPEKPPTTRYWLVSRHTTLGFDAYVFGPFKTERQAREYPGTFRGFVDSPALRYPYKHRVVELPKGRMPQAPEATYVR